MTRAELPLRLEKHHGLGNDFLVLLDLDGVHAVDAPLARALCDRHRGIGADGLVRVIAGRDGADVAMELRNADGSSAETSGNGLRCAAQAAVMAGIVPRTEVTIATAAGVRRAEVGPETGPGQRSVSVEMGRATPGHHPVPDDVPGKALAVDLGNPHVVVLVDDLDEARSLGEVNAEFVVADARDRVTMRVFERGVGETQSCGSGACAAAYAAREWGLVGDHVVVRQPGGDLEVALGDPIVLAGPVQHVASVEVPYLWH